MAAKKYVVVLYLPKKRVALNGVPVEGWTLANQEGTSLALPMTQRYLACPSMATSREATIPRLAPTPTTLLAHFHPMFWKAMENDALSEICMTHKYSNLNSACLLG